MEMTEKKLYANCVLYSDITPFEVVNKISDKTLEIRSMSCEQVSIPSHVIGGFCANFNNNEQKWNITSDESSPVFRIRLNNRGQWHDSHGNRYSLNTEPVKHYDFNF